MRQEHRAGEKFFVDYSGQTVLVVYGIILFELRVARFLNAFSGQLQFKQVHQSLKFFRLTRNVVGSSCAFVDCIAILMCQVI